MIAEFDLDAPKEEKSVRLRFRNETRCITALFERCYAPTAHTGKQWKVLVDVVKAVEIVDCLDLLGVATLQVQGDIDHFFELDAPAKKRRTLEYLTEGISKIAQQEGWSMRDFLLADEEVRNRDFVNEWVWKRPVYNRSRSLRAEVVVNHGISRARIAVRFRDKKSNVMGVTKLVDDEPNEFICDEYFGKLHWLDEQSVELVSRDGTKRFSAKLGDTEGSR